jgi:hypothetical protein
MAVVVRSTAAGSGWRFLRENQQGEPMPSHLPICLAKPAVASVAVALVFLIARLQFASSPQNRENVVESFPNALVVNRALGKKLEAFVPTNKNAAINGRVIYDGTPPIMPKINLKGHADEASCCAGPDKEPREQTWLVGQGKGVANVVVFLEPPAGMFFAHDERPAKELRSDAILDQRYCVYEPHVVTLFVAYKTTGGKLLETGARLLVKNSGKIAHNTKITGDPRWNPTINRNIVPATTDGTFFPIAYQREPIDVLCDKHPWMSAKLVTFTHPYFAVTDKDVNFEIRNVPSGVDLMLKTWHEQAESVQAKTTLNVGVNKVSIRKIKAVS